MLAIVTRQPHRTNETGLAGELANDVVGSVRTTVVDEQDFGHAVGVTVRGAQAIDFKRRDFVDQGWQRLLTPVHRHDDRDGVR